MSAETPTAAVPPGRPGYAYGGQALMEGVLMRGRDAIAVALRHPDGRIVTATERLDSGFHGKRYAKWPFVRSGSPAQSMPNARITLRTAVASLRRLLAGWNVLSMAMHSPGTDTLYTPTICWSSMPSIVTCAPAPSAPNTIGRRSTPRKSASMGANIAIGPPAAPVLTYPFNPAIPTASTATSFVTSLYASTAACGSAVSTIRRTTERICGLHNTTADRPA